jgi:hypothetical protein
MKILLRIIYGLLILAIWTGSCAAANDFSRDSSCLAVYRFESGAVTTDSKGSNTLTITGSGITADAAHYWEGAASVAFSGSGGFGSLSRADASLPAGWPFKSTDTALKGSFSFWIKPTTFTDLAGIFGPEVWNGNGSFCFYWSGTGGSLHMQWCYGAGTYNDINTAFTATLNHVYYMGVVIDGLAHTCHLRVWDQTAGTWASYDPTVPAQDMSVGTQGFVIGKLANTFQGNLDEFVVFNALKSDLDFYNIKNQTYTPLKGGLMVQNLLRLLWHPFNG